MTQFEFASYYYQYKIESSPDGKNWTMYADKSKNRISGSPMIDDNDVSARYMKLTVLVTEKTGLYAAVWNIKVYSSLFDIPLKLVNKPSNEGPGVPSTKKLLVRLDLEKVKDDDPLTSLPNTGSIGGVFTKSGEVSI